MLSRAASLSLAAACALTLATSAAASAPKTRAEAAPTSTQAGVDGIPPGYVRVDSPTFTAPTGTQTRGTVSCPAGTVVFGGSIFLFSPSLLANVNSSFPLSNTSWAADVNNASGANATFDVEVICGFQPKSYAIRSKSAPNPSGSQASVKATCPSGSQPLSGGAFSTSSLAFTNLTSTFPQRRTWRIVESNASAANASVTAFAVCAKLPGYTVVDPGFDQPVAAGAQTVLGVTCPDRTLVVGGGVRTNSTSVGVTIGASWVDDGNWNEHINDNSGVSFSARPFVVCVGV
jgi:hypothetical protein